jgi:hypothetical protein
MATKEEPIAEPQGKSHKFHSPSIWPQSHQAIEDSFAKRVHPPSKGSILGVQLISSQGIDIESKFVHKSVAALLADHGCKVSLSGASLDLLIKRLIELVELQKKTANLLSLQAQTLSDQLAECETEAEKEELLKIFSKLRIAIHWENFVIQRVILIRQLLLEVYAQCRNVQARIKKRVLKKAPLDENF